jgi:hypothetical protein
LKNFVFWDVVLCRYWVNRRFGGMYRLHLQGIRTREREIRVSKWLQTELSRKQSAIYEQGEWEGRPHGKSTERRGVGSMVKVSKRVAEGSTQRHTSEHDILHSHRRENLKSYDIILFCVALVTCKFRYPVFWDMTSLSVFAWRD